MPLVYGLKTTLSRILYVGKTSGSLASRMAAHRSAARSGSMRPVHVWIREVGDQNVEILELETVDPEELSSREEFWMHELETLESAGGRNAYLGSKPVPKTVQARRSAAQQKRYATPGSRERVAIGARRRLEDPQELARIRELAPIANRLGNHVRWHVNRGRVSPTCEHCAT